ncbi:MAG: P-loop NTPase [Acidimicrobiaceae bacterium]|nr:P-loop NTPase [Acidimicrobiaceae bacterium]MCY4176259.1 P-loop NTPase [Acidimicrobiaceae bacterium]MCY4280237.1 P-loop NTPase [Acidimicrobiaceae bacterium]
MIAALPTSEDVMDMMRGVIDPELGSNLVELGMARGAEVSDEGEIRIKIALTTSGCPLRAQIQRDVKARLESLPGVTKVRILWGELTAEEKAAAMAKARFNVAQQAPDTAIPPTTKVLMVASGKGGVGKSTVTTNLAAALAALSFKVGVMDADIWGYSVPRMLGVGGDLRSLEGRIVPITRSIGDGRLDVVSMGFLVDREDSALMWRGLMLNRAVQHFCEDVAWSDDLDYLLIDMPPGTGDVQMGLAKMLPRAEMIVVTTPAVAAQKVAARVVDMGRKNYLRIVGVIENMSALVTATGEQHAVFGSGGGDTLAAEVGAPLLGRIPLEAAVADGSDRGEPAVLGEGAAAAAFKAVAEALSSEHVPPVEMAGCSARMLDAAAAALDALDNAES